MDWFALIIDFGRKKDKISNEWMIELYFVSLQSESEVKKVVGLLTCKRSIQNHIIFYTRAPTELYAGPT